MRNEKSSSTLSTEIITNIIRDEAKGRFDARSAIPGHVQQGGNPSPMDRVRATRFAIKACEFIERSVDHISREPETAGVSVMDRLARVNEERKTAAVLGVRSSKLVFSPVDQVWAFETEHKERRPKKDHWKLMARTGDRLVNRVKV